MADLDADLPPGALCAATPGALGAALADAIWWHGDPALMEVDPATGALARWHSVAGTAPLLPTDPNTGNGTTRQVGGQCGLECRPGRHCGLVAEEVMQDARRATIAIRFHVPPGAEARTLLTLNAARGGNYLFLSEAGGVLSAKDDAGRIEVALPCPPSDAPRLVIAALDGDRLAVHLDGGRDGAQAETQASGAVLHGPASLFVGCRNHRPRLLKTLGGALILDVWLFPGRALLFGDAVPDRAALGALQRHHLWAGP